MVRYEEFEMPVGIEAAAFRADAMVRKDKTLPVGVFADGKGHPTVNFYELDGSTTAVTFIGGEWRKMVMLDG